MTDNELYHHGILGMKWGIRRFQNSDGSLTSLGQSHRDVRESRFDFDSLKKSATDFIGTYKDKSFSEIKIDALDYMNRKGVLDIFDSSADAPFESIREIEKYQSESSKNVLKALENTERYLGYKKDSGKTTLAMDRISDENAYRKMLDHYTKSDAKRGYKGLVEGLLKNSDTALADKKLGILSKDARDIERQSMGADFAKDLKSMSIADLSSKWYNTKEDGRREEFPEERKQKITYEKKKIEGHYEDKQVQEKEGFKEWHDPHKRIYQYDWEKEAGINGAMVLQPDWNYLRKQAGVPGFEDAKPRTQPEWAWYPYNEEGYIDQPRIDFSNDTVTRTKQVYVPEQEVLVPTKIETTKEYSDWLSRQAEENTMPSDYSHMTSKYKSSVNLGKDWMNQVSDNYKMAHSDLTEDFLAHHGIMGMHWGERKYQNADGSLTEEGRRHYGVGPAREFAKKIGDTAKRAGEAVSTAARKTFKPTSEDMDEKLAKAYEKQAIKDKKNELRALKGHNKKMKDMSDQEVWQEIQSRNNRKTLEQMRNDASTIRQGGKFVAGMASTAAKPIGALAKMGAEVALDSAKYGLTRAARSAIDDAVENASKKRRLENRTDSEKLRDEANDVRNKTDIQRMESENRMRSLKDETEARRMMSENRMRDARDTNELHRIQAEENLRSTKTSYEKAKMENDINRFASETSLREAKNASERTKAQRDAAVNFLEYQTAMGSEGSSQYSAERLQRLKNNRVSDNNNSGGGNKNKNKNKNKS